MNILNPLIFMYLFFGDYLNRKKPYWKVVILYNTDNTDKYNRQIQDHSGWATWEISFSVSRHHYPSSQSLRQSGRTGAGVMRQERPGGCWMCRGEVGPVSVWPGRTRWAAATSDWFDGWDPPPGRPIKSQTPPSGLILLKFRLYEDTTMMQVCTSMNFWS